MSWLSAAWTRNKGAIASIAGSVPVVGGVLRAGVTAIKTGDYVAPGTTPTADPRLQAEADRVAKFAAEQNERYRQMAADEVARIGYAATTNAAAAIGPPDNIYKRAVALSATNPIAFAGGLILVLVLLFIVLKKR